MAEDVVEDFKSLWFKEAALPMIEPWLKRHNMVYFIVPHEAWGKRVLMRASDYSVFKEKVLDRTFQPQGDSFVLGFED